MYDIPLNSLKYHFYTYTFNDVYDVFEPIVFINNKDLGTYCY